MKKLIKITLLLIVICFAILLFLIFYTSKISDINSKIGMNNLDDTTMTEYYTVKDACIGKYFKYLSEGNIEKAYNLLSEEYKDYKSLNEYKKLVENNGAYTYEVEKIYKKNNGLYIAELTVNNNETKYLVYIDETTKAFSISPDSLIKYYDKSYSINKWDFSFKIQDYIVETNKNIFNVTIKNKSSKNSLNITNVIVYSNNDSIYGNDDEIILAPKEEKTFQIITDNNIELPNSISIIRNKAEKNEIKKYSLDF